MGESANLCENRLLSYLSADNAAFTTTLSFPPVLRVRSVKTGGFWAMATRAEVKTELFGEPQPERIWLVTYKHSGAVMWETQPEEDSDEFEAVPYVRADVASR